MTSTTQELKVRPYQVTDKGTVLQIIEADRLPGQRPTTPAMLDAALAGRSQVDAGWWAELDPPRTDVLVTEARQVVGVVSYATRSWDGAGVVLWLHAREDPTAVAMLIDHALVELGARRVEALAFASALSRGLEGLPVHHRSVTHCALRAAGFTGQNLWRYMRRELGAADSQPAAFPAVAVHSSEEPMGWRLELHDTDGTVLAEATLGAPVDPIAVVWWIEVKSRYRGRGYGRAILAHALAHLARAGAREVILFVDDDEPPGGERDRAAANRLYDAVGFVEIDRLYSYQRLP